MKKKILVTVTTFLLITLTATMALATATPIVDGTNILSYSSTTWDVLGHTLGGLQVERGNGFINFVLPRSVDHTTAWGLHAFVSLTDATFTGVTPGNGFYVLEGNWDNGLYGGANPYDDEIDWYGDSHRVPTGGVSNARELEFWLMTNSARDGFTANVNYGFCPRMTIALVNPGEDPRYGAALSAFKMGSAAYSYPTTIPLANCEFNIDIKPGSYPNSVNINEHGVVPVAILGSADFDVTSLNLASLVFEGLTVRTKGNGDAQCSVKDVSGANMPYGEPDGYPDLVCQFVDADGYLATGNGTATVKGTLYDGTPISGTDSINLVNQ